jgi:hypothetical protein
MLSKAHSTYFEAYFNIEMAAIKGEELSLAR